MDGKKVGVILAFIVLAGILFFSFGGMNLIKNPKITGMLTDRGVGMNISMSNTAPIVTFVSVIPNVDLILNGSRKLVVNFTAYDADGADNINDLTARINLSKSGEPNRINSSCAWLVDFGNSANYTCDVYLWYFDSSGSWSLNATINDTSNAKAGNSTLTFSVNALTGFDGPTSLSWGSVTPGSWNTTASSALTLNNTGNQNIADGDIQINATNLKGETDNTKALWNRNFSIGITTGGTPAFSCNATTMNSNYSYIGVAGAALNKGNFSINDGTGQEQLFFCLKYAGTELTQQAYSTAEESSWTVKIA